ncbi:MAG: hypothetical protein EZS28_011955 [Streblomastix strix]|uniref:C2 domain-containing protein n=1 Tax=Streblomastix strix TaxID=222440 RepID=A0A5J4WC45_9EUKA|nr:MAG: hypothetical protein EZS28_011955 [Streblomastix strix]
MKERKEIDIEVWDQDRIGSNDLIGAGIVEILPIFEREIYSEVFIFKNKDRDGYYHSQSKLSLKQRQEQEKNCGKVCFSLMYISEYKYIYDKIDEVNKKKQKEQEQKQKELDQNPKDDDEKKKKEKKRKKKDDKQKDFDYFDPLKVQGRELDESEYVIGIVRVKVLDLIKLAQNEPKRKPNPFTRLIIGAKENETKTYNKAIDVDYDELFDIDFDPEKTNERKLFIEVLDRKKKKYDKDEYEEYEGDEDDYDYEDEVFVGGVTIQFLLNLENPEDQLREIEEVGADEFLHLGDVLFGILYTISEEDVDLSALLNKKKQQEKKNKKKAEIKIVQLELKAGLWVACCNESTDISTLNQFITFARYVDSNGVIQNKFMDIRSLVEKGGKASNLLDKFKSIAKEKELDLLKFCSFSCGEAAPMMGVKNGDTSIIELPSICKCLKKISEENFEVIAEGLLNVTTKFSFISSLLILKHVLFQLKILSETFYEGSLCYDYIKLSLSNFKKGMVKINKEKMSSQIFRENQARYETFLEKYFERLGELDEKKMSQMEELSCKYVDATLKAVEKRFQDNDAMPSFKIFDNTAVPEKIDDNSEFENLDQQILNNRFWKLSGRKSCNEAEVEILKGWKDFSQQLNDNFIGCTTRDEQRSLIRSQSFLQYPILRMLSQVALTLPMSSALAERGFSQMNIIKTDLRSKQTERMLSFLLNIKINSPIQLSDDYVNAIVAIRIKKKERINVNQRQKQHLINKDSQLEVPDYLPDSFQFQQF